MKALSDGDYSAFGGWLPRNGPRLATNHPQFTRGSTDQKPELATRVPWFLPARSWCRSSLSNCSIATVQDGNASGSWSGRALARKISVKRESAAAASLEPLAAATMKSWITVQRFSARSTRSTATPQR